MLRDFLQKSYQQINMWIILALLGQVSHSLVESWIRPIYGKGESLGAFLLGVAPNFLAAALIFPFFFLVIRNPKYEQAADPQHLQRWFYGGLVFSQVGLILWEFNQLTGGLVFDWNDIVATLVGGAFAILLYHLNKQSYLQQSGWNKSY